MDLNQLLEGKCKLLFLPVKNVQLLCTNVHYINLLNILFSVLVDNMLAFFLAPAGLQKKYLSSICTCHRPQHCIRGVLFHCILFLLSPPSAKKLANGDCTV